MLARLRSNIVSDELAKLGYKVDEVILPGLQARVQDIWRTVTNVLTKVPEASMHIRNSRKQSSSGHWLVNRALSRPGACPK